MRAAFRSSHETLGNLVVTVLHFEVATLTDPPNMNSVATDLSTHFGTLYRAILTGSFRLHDIVVTTEDYPGETPRQGSASIEGLGTRAPSDLNLDFAICAVTTFRTATPKRYARGRMFNPPCVDGAQLDPGGIFKVAGAYKVACNAFAAAYLATWSAGSTDYGPIVFSKHQVAVSSPDIAFPVTSATVGARQHWLRSRTSSP